ncbi:FtsW/RodA/SpoVE family cell cycle protein [Clostridiales bacterium COT073_COT-073]|nr:FtsW/RodA/SpoVE family cell cycle protein [Clostridiales bacterium COT073_COT-073]
MKEGLIIFSLLFLAGNYLAYKEKISAALCFALVLAGEIMAMVSLYSWQGYSRQLLWVSCLVFLFSVIAFLLPHWLPNLNLLIWAEITFLVQTGTFILYRIDGSLAFRHIIICLAGLLLIWPVQAVIKLFSSAYRFHLIYYVLAVVLLLMNNVTRYGATNWTQIGDFVFQPSEFVKILFSLFLASYLLREYRLKVFIRATVLSFAVIGILVLQRDLGGAFIFFTIYVVITYMYSHNKWLLAVQFAGAGGAAVASAFLFTHVRVRIISWLAPFAYAENEGYQIVRSLQALMNGKWLGTGLGYGQPARIPVVTSDFLFAAIGEEYGAIYLLLFVLHFCFLILLLYNQCLKSQNKFYFYAGTSLTTMLAIQGFLIMAGCSGMIPLTGVVLPFVSYGGSAMIGNFMIAAMIETMTKAGYQGPRLEDVFGSSSRFFAQIEPGDQMQVKALAKYIRILKYFIFGLYLIFTLYLIWLYAIWVMPVI